MSAQPKNDCNEIGNDDIPLSRDESHNSTDSLFQQDIDRARLPIAMPYQSDAQRIDTETVDDDDDARSVHLSQEDMKRRTAPTALSLAALSSQELEQVRTFQGPNTDPSPGRFSEPHAGGDMFPPLNRAYMLHRDFLKSSTASDNTIDGVDVAAGLQGGDDEQQKSLTPMHLSSATFPIDSTTGSFSAAIRRYMEDVNPHAPSSVKSFGSNVGSDDCGGSLDVETHSIGARSNHSQEDILPVAMPDPDPETVAVASLSIDPVDHGEHRTSFGSVYKSIYARQQHDRFMHLPLQRFHNNHVQFDHADYGGGDFEQSVGHDHHSFSSQPNHRTPINWNDPRIDDSSSEPSQRETIHSTRSIQRSRSRSRSPTL